MRLLAYEKKSFHDFTKKVLKDDEREKCTSLNFVFRTKYKIADLWPFFHEIPAMRSKEYSPPKFRSRPRYAVDTSLFEDGFQH